MPVLKVIEILAQSDKSWEDAAQLAVNKAAESQRNIKFIYIKKMEATVENNKITNYRISSNITFMLE